MMSQIHLKKMAYIDSYFRDAVVNLGGYYIDNKKHDFNAEVISQKEGHINKETHQKFAQMLYKEIIDSERWGFYKY